MKSEDMGLRREVWVFMCGGVGRRCGYGLGWGLVDMVGGGGNRRHGCVVRRIHPTSLPKAQSGSQSGTNIDIEDERPVLKNIVCHQFTAQ